MGFADRDYNRSPGPSPLWQTMQRWPITYWLIATNIAVFALDFLTHRILSELGWFSYNTAITHLQI